MRRGAEARGAAERGSGIYGVRGGTVRYGYSTREATRGGNLTSTVLLSLSTKKEIQRLNIKKSPHSSIVLVYTTGTILEY